MRSASAHRRCICSTNRADAPACLNKSPHLRHNCGDQCGLSNIHDEANCIRCGPPAPPDGVSTTQTAPMRRRVLMHVLIYDTISTINILCPAPMTTKIAYDAVRRRCPMVHLLHKPRRCAGMFYYISSCSTQLRRSMWFIQHACRHKLPTLWSAGADRR